MAQTMSDTPEAGASNSSAKDGCTMCCRSCGLCYRFVHITMCRKSAFCCLCRTVFQIQEFGPYVLSRLEYTSTALKAQLRSKHDREIALAHAVEGYAVELEAILEDMAAYKATCIASGKAPNPVRVERYVTRARKATMLILETQSQENRNALYITNLSSKLEKVDNLIANFKYHVETTEAIGALQSAGFGGEFKPRSGRVVNPEIERIMVNIDMINNELTSNFEEEASHATTAEDAIKFLDEKMADMGLGDLYRGKRHDRREHRLMEKQHREATTVVRNLGKDAEKQRKQQREAMAKYAHDVEEKKQFTVDVAETDDEIELDTTAPPLSPTQKAEPRSPLVDPDLEDDHVAAEPSASTAAQEAEAETR